MGVIKTILGNYFDILNPMAYDYPIEEIAWHLSKINRFTGATRIDYSVARHSVYVAIICPPHLKLEGLLHDATEAYLNDVAKPLKDLLPGYKRIERRVDRAIRHHYGLPKDENPIVKSRDAFALRVENRCIMTPHKQPHPDGFEEDQGMWQKTWHETTSVQDCDNFLRMYYELLAPTSMIEQRSAQEEILDVEGLGH